MWYYIVVKYLKHGGGKPCVVFSVSRLQHRWPEQLLDWRLSVCERENKREKEREREYKRDRDRERDYIYKFAWHIEVYDKYYYCSYYWRKRKKNVFCVSMNEIGMMP